MLTLPMPAVVALALTYTAALAWLGSDRRRLHPLIVRLVALVAGQSLLVALVQHYGFTGLRWIQPVIASAIPPLTWCAFLAVQVRPLGAREAAHGLAPLLVLLALVFWPDGIDLLVIGSFVGYGVALLLALRPGAAEMPLARLASGQVPRWLWRFMALSLLVSGAGDVLIFVDQLTQGGASRAALISAMSSLALLALGSIGLSSEWRTSETVEMERGAPEAVPSSIAVHPEPKQPCSEADIQEGADPMLLERLEVYMRDARPWLDPDLSLLALARKLGVPSKALSAAVNLGYGENVARYVNRHRIEHACTLLRAGQPVTRVIFDSGFNTKSNFHREFLRIHQMTPTQWLAQAGVAVGPSGLLAPASTSPAGATPTRP